MSVYVGVCWYVKMFICWFVSMSVCHFVSMLVCQYVSMSICQYVIVSVCQYVNMWVCWYVGMLIFWYVGVSVCNYVTTSIFECVNVSMSLYVSMSIFQYFNKSMTKCKYVSISVCWSYHQKQEQKQTMIKRTTIKILFALVTKIWEKSTTKNKYRSLQHHSNLTNSQLNYICANSQIQNFGTKLPLWHSLYTTRPVCDQIIT